MSNGDWLPRWNIWPPCATKCSSSMRTVESAMHKACSESSPAMSGSPSCRACHDNGAAPLARWRAIRAGDDDSSVECPPVRRYATDFRGRDLVGHFHSGCDSRIPRRSSASEYDRARQSTVVRYGTLQVDRERLR